jgi:uncharacterized membrane protein
MKEGPIPETKSMRRQNVAKVVNACTDGVKGFCYRSPHHIVTYLIRGIIILLPLVVTVWVLRWLYNLLDGLLAPVITMAFGHPVPGVGFGIILVLIILAGFLGIVVGYRRIFQIFEDVVAKIPLVGAIYGGTRQIVTSFTTSTSSKFVEVVFLEFPRKGIYTVGLVTGRVTDENGRCLVNVFVPTAPNPTSGFLQIVPEPDIIKSNMSVNDAMKLVISGGKVANYGIADVLVQSVEPDNKAAVAKV